MLTCLVFVAALQPLTLNALTARCNMRLHKNGTEIGEVTFKSSRNVQEVTAFLQGDPLTVSQGYYGLHVHKNPVKAFDCSATSTGGHYNPKGVDHGSPLSRANNRHVGDFGNIRAGDRGEINYRGKYIINPHKKITASALLEPVIFCDNNDVESDKSSDKKKKRKKKGKKSRSPDQKLEQNHNNSVERDCYQPKWLNVEASVQAPLFDLSGDQSIVGRAVVIHAHEDDQGNSGTAKSRKTGNAGKSVACCTLEVV